MSLLVEKFLGFCRWLFAGLFFGMSFLVGCKVKCSSLGCFGLSKLGLTLGSTVLMFFCFRQIVEVVGFLRIDLSSGFHRGDFRRACFEEGALGSFGFQR